MHRNYGKQYLDAVAMALFSFSLDSSRVRPALSLAPEGVVRGCRWVFGRELGHAVTVAVKGSSRGACRKGGEKKEDLEERGLIGYSSVSDTPSISAIFERSAPITLQSTSNFRDSQPRSRRPQRELQLPVRQEQAAPRPPPGIRENPVDPVQVQLWRNPAPQEAEERSGLSRHSGDREDSALEALPAVRRQAGGGRKEREDEGDALHGLRRGVREGQRSSLARAKAVPRRSRGRRTGREAGEALRPERPATAERLEAPARGWPPRIAAAAGCSSPEAPLGAGPKRAMRHPRGATPRPTKG